MSLAGLPALLAWIKTQGVELLRGPAATPAAQAGFKPGETYLGKVLENLGNGRSLVQIGSQTLEMRMPPQARQAQPGDTLRLTYLTSTARPTFALHAEAEAVPTRAAVQVSNAAQQVNALANHVRALAAQGGGASSTAPAAAATASAAAASGAVPPRAGAAQTATLATASGVSAPAGSVTAASASPATLAGGALASTVAGALAAAPSAPGAQNLGQAAPSLAQLAMQAAQLNPAPRPLVQNAALLLAGAAGLGGGPPVWTPGSHLPALALSGPALEAARAAMSMASGLQAQGMMLASSPGVLMLAQRLRQSFAESGLFYESHLGRWVRGGWSLEAVQREPQARLAELVARGAARLGGVDGMPEEAARLAGRQLLMLEGAPAAWHGTAWPGQAMSWWIEEGEGSDTPEEGEARWRTRLRLTLPRLGEVEAAIEIGARGLGIDIEAADADAHARLQAALPELVAQMQAAELPLVRVQVRRKPELAEEAMDAGV